MKFKVGDYVRLNLDILLHRSNIKFYSSYISKNDANKWFRIAEVDPDMEDYFKVEEFIENEYNMDDQYLLCSTDIVELCRRVKDSKIARKLYKNQIKKVEDGWIILK